MNIKISGFEEWAKNMLLEYKASNKNVQCPCCESNEEDWCDYCEGSGKIPFNEVSGFRFEYPVFLEAVYTDLKKLCVYTNKDFLGAVGEFIKTEQPRKKMHLTSNGKES